jgi:tRNA-splicing ligase RtcB (3'-phosphate/5'-hydroxy nucleic acid ligase)
MKPYKTYGKENVEQGALTQMDNVMSLPCVVKGALMPDAHQGYGMPIGGVCAVENAVIPYAVGVDIGCRMHLTVLKNSLDLDKDLRGLLKNNTYFGGYACPKVRADEAVMDDHRWALLGKYGIKLPQERSLKDRAHWQLGTSGGGNHFVEWGDFFTNLADGQSGLFRGALLSHSGSRSLGYTVANFFTKLAAKINPLPEPLNELSWLSMDTEEGQDYWSLMNLCGEYSAANHRVIHRNVLEAAGLKDEVLKEISNHHNFAWLEKVEGRMLYVHRKGATPAGQGVEGIIPSSMATPAYVVQGKGDPEALQSASHGSGRAMSRSKALKSITQEARQNVLKAAGVDLIGGGLDEAPQAYKDIQKVMEAQKDLVEVKATFLPRVVRMAGKDEEDKSEGA